MDEILSRLAEIVGEEYVSNNAEELFLYHWDFMTAEMPGKCDYVVMPKTPEEISQIMKLANIHKIPVVPWVSGINVGGICIPRRGGIVVDLRRMNEVVQANLDDLYLVVEGGITWGDLKGYLEKNHPEYTTGITWSPAGTGVIPSLLSYGMLNMGMLGTGAEFINGVEAVLPTGEIVRTGSCMSTDYWYGRQPHPDLTGLFIGWMGTTGIVTKAGIKIWPKNLIEHYIIIADKMEQGIEIFKKLAHAGLGIIDLCCLNYIWLTAAQGFKESNKIPYEPEKEGTPDFYGLVSLTAYTHKEMEAKTRAIEEIAQRHEAMVAAPYMQALNLFPENQRGELKTFLNPPIHFYCVWDYSRGGGGEWVGSYLSSRHIAQYYYIAREIAKKYGKHACFYSRVLQGGHSWIARVNINFNKGDPKDIEKTRKCLKEIDLKVRRLGSVIRYKPPEWAAERNLAQANKETIKLMEKIRRLLDPNQIMNPGHGL